MVVWREKLVDDDTNQIYSQFLLKNMVLPSFIESIKAQHAEWLMWGVDYIAVITI